MNRWVLAAALLAAAVVPQAMAADLDDGGPPPPPWKYGAYGYPPKAIPPPSHYDEDDDDDDGPPYAKKHADVPPYKGSCVRSEQVRDRLTSLGWRDFHSGKAINQTTVMLRARRRSGRLFELHLDRCSGEILAARPLEFSPNAGKHHDGPYGRPWRWAPFGHSNPYGYGPKGPYGYGPKGYMGPYAYSPPWRERPYRYGRPPRDWDDD